MDVIDGNYDATLAQREGSRYGGRDEIRCTFEAFGIALINPFVRQ